jgi:hypothetical protein
VDVVADDGLDGRSGLRPAGARGRGGEGRDRRPRRGRRDARAHRGVPADDRLPTGLTPACTRYAEYTFQAELHRTKGTNSTAASIVDVVARPADLYWPDGPRAGQDGPDEARIAIAFDGDDDTVEVGTTLTGRVTVLATRELAGQDVQLAFGPTVDTLVPVAGKSQAQPRARFQPTVRTTLAPRRALASGERLELPFRLDVAAGAPPTLHNGGQTSVVWQVRVAFGDTVAWRRVGVLDPVALAGRRDEPSPGLLSFLASLDTPGR